MRTGVALVALGLLILPGCTEEGSYRLHLLLPDTEAAQLLSEVEVWVVEPGGRACEELTRGDLAPDELVVQARQLLAYPPVAAGTRVSIPAGTFLFFAEGRTLDGAIILRGCSVAEVRAGQDLAVDLTLAWYCHPGGDEIPGNDEDDDCDGLTDECEDKAECNDGNGCTADFCIAGTCQYDAFPDELACNDEDQCTADDACLDGACTGAQKDCSAYDAPCVRGVCDPQSGACGPEFLPEGNPCDDEQYCTVDGTCQDGRCVSSPRACDDGDACTRDECNEGEKRCDYLPEPIPGAEGLSVAGSCQNGLDDDCDGMTDEHDANCSACQVDGDCGDDNPCTQDTCEGDECQNALVANGTDCDDERFCTVDDKCDAGVCRGGPRDCATIADACNEGVCLEAGACCQAQPLPDGTSCNDGLYCTQPDRCDQGTCLGEQRDCDDGDVCTQDACDEDFDRCDHVLSPIPGAEGPVGEPTCSNGVDDDCDGHTDIADGDCSECSGPAECDDGNACTDDTCDAGSCVHDAVPNGTACEDGFFCTEPDQCAAGVCQGADLDCSDSDPTTQDLCNEALDRCENPASRRQIYRSVGPGNTDALAEGAGNPAWVSGTTASFGQELPLNVGVGDMLQYDSDGNGEVDALAMITGRRSSTEYDVATASGLPPVETISDTEGWALFRAYTSLSHAIDVWENPGIASALRDFDPFPPDLVADDRVWHVACYADAVDSEGVFISNWDWHVEPGNYIRIYAPVDGGEVGVSQRHTGRWTESAYILRVSYSEAEAIEVYAIGDLRIEGLQIDVPNESGDPYRLGITAFGLQDHHRLQVASCIIRGHGQGAGIEYVGAEIWNSLPGATMRFFNNVVYGFTGTATDQIGVWAGSSVLIAHNNTFVDVDVGVYVDPPALAVARNNLVSSSGQAAVGTFQAGTRCNATDDDAIGYTVEGGADPCDRAGVAFAFESLSGADYHLSPTDTGARDAGTNEVDGLFTDDIDGQIRGGGPWDIGADEYLP